MRLVENERLIAAARVVLSRASCSMSAAIYTERHQRHESNANRCHLQQTRSGGMQHVHNHKCSSVFPMLGRWASMGNAYHLVRVCINFPIWQLVACLQELIPSLEDLQNDSREYDEVGACL